MYTFVYILVSYTDVILLCLYAISWVDIRSGSIPVAGRDPGGSSLRQNFFKLYAPVQMQRFLPGFLFLPLRRNFKSKTYNSADRGNFSDLPYPVVIFYRRFSIWTWLLFSIVSSKCVI